MDLKQLEPIMEEVGKYKFYITPFPAFKAMNMTGEIARVAGPLVGCLLPMLGNGGLSSIANMDVSVAANMFAGASAIDGEKVEQLSRKLLLGGHIVVETKDEITGERDGERLTEEIVNEVFCGDVANMYVLCYHVIKLNFGDFFSKLDSQFGQVENMQETKSKQRKIL